MTIMCLEHLHTDVIVKNLGGTLKINFWYVCIKSKYDINKWDIELYSPFLKSLRWAADAPRTIKRRCCVVPAAVVVDSAANINQINQVNAKMRFAQCPSSVMAMMVLGYNRKRRIVAVVDVCLVLFDVAVDFVVWVWTGWKLLLMLWYGG